MWSAEKILITIALVLQFLVVLLGMLFVAFIYLQYPDQLPVMVELRYAWIVLGIHLIGLIAGCAVLFYFKKHRRRSGIVLIGTAVLMGISTLGATLIQSVLFIAAGILCLTRQPLIERQEVNNL
ncbi:hypothetical protein [Halobacillus massiliensis]|uniref:hypothetical protein n=1 Tax=Halobacillus massiliensis TaxID=1926286 RepID=UPI0009E64569|nr:hypothetical protein [Halobacillus massiliensis]